MADRWRVWGWILVIIGAALILMGLCLETGIIYLTNSVPVTAPDAYYNFGYIFAKSLLDICIAPPEIIAGIVVIVIGARMVRKKAHEWRNIDQ
jgi:hypothetical protein